jgi:hypothetical protein
MKWLGYLAAGRLTTVRDNVPTGRLAERDPAFPPPFKGIYDSVEILESFPV